MVHSIFLAYLSDPQSFSITSLQVFFGLPLGLTPSTSKYMHFSTKSFSSCLKTCPYHLNLCHCVVKYTNHRSHVLLQVYHILPWNISRLFTTPEPISSTIHGEVGTGCKIGWTGETDKTRMCLSQIIQACPRSSMYLDILPSPRTIQYDERSKICTHTPCTMHTRVRNYIS